MLKIDYPFKTEILACGTQRQANFCITKKKSAFIVNNLGNLDEQGAFERYQQSIESARKELKVKPKVVAHDLHPGYTSTKYAQGLSKEISGVKFVPVQHHQAHIASCFGENGLTGKVIGVVFDGGEVGEDGQDWGGEFFIGNPKKFKRVAHLKYTPVWGGKNSTLESWQQAADFLYQTFSDDCLNLKIDFVGQHQQDKWALLRQDAQPSLHSSSMARFFDAVCALVGLRQYLDYEGQGAAELERIINRSSHVANRVYPVSLENAGGIFLICPEPIFAGIVTDLKNNVSKSIISAALYNTTIEIVRQLCHKIEQKEKINDVVLTGSVFQSQGLLNRLKDLLLQDGFNVITHSHFTCSDESISFGQAVLADALLV